MSTPQGEKLFLAWISHLESLLKMASKTKGKSLLKSRKEGIIVSPAKMALCLRGVTPHPRISTLPWDEAGNLNLFRTSGKLYRKFANRGNDSETTFFKYRFLVYKRYNSELLTQALPTDAKGLHPLGLHGATELLYSPNANIPKAGRKIVNYMGFPLMESNDDVDESKRLVGESLAISELIPVGNKGFYLFCSTQQKNPHKVEAGRNERMVIGPNSHGTRVRTAHLIRKLSHGKPEETPKILREVEQACGNLLMDNLEKIFEMDSDPKDFYSKPEEELQSLQKDWEKTVLKNKNGHIHGGIRITISPNTTGTQSAEDSCIILNFGSTGSHEREVENEMIEARNQLTKSK